MDYTAHKQWEKWIRENQNKWLLYARQQTRSESDAQDVLQEAIVAVWKEYSTRTPENELPPEGEALSPKETALKEPEGVNTGTVFAAIRFRAINLARGTQRREQRNENYMALVWDTSEDAKYGSDEQELLLESLRSLPEAQAEVVTLHIWGELTFAQIGDICHSSMNTIAARYKMALKKLQNSLKETLKNEKS